MNTNRINTYKSILKELRLDKNMSKWDKDFISILLSYNTIKLTDKQRDVLLKIIDKSWINSNYKILIKNILKSIK